MFELSTVTFFGLSQMAIGDLSTVTAAIGAAEVLEPEDVYALVDSLGGEQLERLADGYFEAHRRGDVQGALSAKQELLRDLATTNATLWKHSQPKPETKFILFASAMAMRTNADKILKVQAARWQLSIEGDKDHKKAEQALRHIALQALEGNELGKEQLETIAEGKSRLAPAAKMILDRFDRLKELAQAQTRLELAQKGSAMIEEEHQKIFEALRTGRLQFDRILGERLSAFTNGPVELICVIDHIKGQSTPQWKEGRLSESSVLFHQLVNDRALDVYAGTFLIESASVGETPDSDLILSILSLAGKVKGLSAVVHSAVIKNVIAATAKGVQISIDVPSDVPIDKRKQEKLEEVLVEMICNAVKYADPDKAEKSIRIGWDAERKVLTIADNGIGIEDTERIWEEGYQAKPDATADRGGLGLAIVKRLLAEIGWTIGVESTLGVGTTFTLLDATAKITLAKQLFRRRYEMSVEACRQIEQLAVNDVGALRKIEEQLRAELQQSSQLFRTMGSGRDNDLMSALDSSSTQLPAAILYVLANVIKNQMASTLFEKAIAIQERKVIGDHGFHYNGTLGELSEDLATYWLLSRSPLNNGWENNSWVLTFPKMRETTYQQPSPLNNSPWPPDPENDIALKTYLELLGWKMTVDASGEQIVVRVDFGENAI